MTRRGLTGIAGAFLLATAVVLPVAGRSPQVPPAAQVQRDTVAQPPVRRVPVGTSTISGTVMAADTGRPLRGVRVNVNG
ncbi:MAG TPA: hypothetical protein VMZ90_02585, partial [Vicinamibacterales bacterium]|nr:hypothetical protein [Vicinamibacterales bacterium]